MPAAVFHDNGASSGNYTTLGANTTFGGNVGMFGALGASPSMRVTYSGAAFVFEGAEKSLASTCTIFQFWYRPAAGATLGTGNSIFTACTTNLYNNATAPIRLDLTPAGASYKFSLVDPSSSFASVLGTTTLTLGVPVRVVVVQTSAGWKLYINNNTTPEITYVKTQATVGMQYVCFGTLNENAAGSFSGIADFGEIWCGNLATAPTTPAGKIADAYNGYLQNHLALSGQPYRGVADGVNYTSVSAIDTVSEGAGYLLKLAVQNNDQASFTLCDNWILANLLRSNSTVANTQINGAPTTALNLMAFHYNSANTDGKGIGTIYDANWAGDGDVERAQALFWAHARFGSSALAVGSGSELVTPNYLQRGLNVISDLRTYAFATSSGTGYNYLLSDSFQLGNSVVQIAPDYVSPAAFALFKNYDSTNVTFWSNAILGAYDIITKASNTIFSGSPDLQASTVKVLPSWLSMTVTTAAVSTTRSSYGDPNYGFNCFRASYRLYDQYVWSGDTAALTALQLPKAEWVSLWGSQAKIPATLNHDGTTLATYELSLFTYSAYWSVYANDTANTTATAINSGKLSNLYSQQPYGSIISDIPSGQQYAYFGQSWELVGYMQQNSLWINWGQLNARGGGTSSGTAAVGVIKPIAATGGGTSSGSSVAIVIEQIAATGGGTSGGSSSIVLAKTIASVGGGTSSGSSALSVTELLTSTGGGTSGGSSALSVTELLTSTGGGTSSGTSIISVTKPIAATGGGTSGGTASVTGFVTYTITASGGGTSSGTVAIADSELIASVGGGTSSGSSTLLVTESFAATGGGTSSGTSPIGVTETLVAVGGGTSSGTATIVASKIITATGGGTGSGSGAISVTEPLVATGGGTSSGTAAVGGFVTYTITATGGGTSSGTSSTLVTTTSSATGGGTSGGTATVVVVQVIAASGGGTSGGTVAIADSELIASVGGGTSNGAASITNTSALTASGSGTSGGTSTIGLTVPILATGGGTSSGTSNVSGFVTYTLTATGGGTSSGTAAVVNTTSVVLVGGGVSSGTASIAVLTTYAVTATGGGTSGGIASINSAVSYAITATGGGLSSGTASLNVKYVPLRSFTSWSTDAPYDATQLLYDNPLRLYDDPTVQYDGTNQTLLLPNKSNWNKGTAPLLGTWTAGSQIIGSYSAYDSSIVIYDSPTMFYDGGQVGSVIEVTNWTKGAAQSFSNWVPGNQVIGSYSVYDSSTIIYDSPTMLYDGGQVGVTIEVTKWTPA